MPYIDVGSIWQPSVKPFSWSNSFPLKLVLVLPYLTSQRGKAFRRQIANER